MQLLDAVYFKRNKPKTVGDFMNFQDKPDEVELTPEEAFAKIDRDVWGL